MAHLMSQLRERVEGGTFVVTAELLTVDSGGLDAVRQRFEPFEPWVDAVNATDNTAAHAHASPLAVAIALKRLGVEPVMQLVCRDRNRLALQADIVGGALHGVENLLCLRGDDVTAGDEPEAKPVFDLGSIDLLQTAAAIANGHYLSGRPIDPAPTLFLGAAESAGDPPYEDRVDRALQKIRAGARFFQLQVCFEHAELEGFMRAAVESGLSQQAAILPSVCLVRTPSALRYMDEKVPGISVPRAMIERVERAADPEAACFELAVEIAERVLELPGIAGLHLISFRREAGIARLCQRLGIPTRNERGASGYRSALTV
jgi:methylenetetrahydrofolate reductase (NADPH)